MMRVLVVLLGFLAMSAAAYRLELRQVYIQGSGGNQTGNDLQYFEDEAKEQLPGICWACKWIVNKVKESLPRDNSASQSEIRQKLLSVCDLIGFLRFLCKPFVRRSIDVLVEELSTTDTAETVCSHVRACSFKSTVEDIVLEALESMQRKKVL
ncbi:non-pathogenic pore-forming peptide-like [Arapaima gigas]